MQTYPEFREQYELQHPASVPQRQPPAQLAYPEWLPTVILIMFGSAALISGAHTVPTIYSGIETGVPELVRVGIALCGFVAIDLAMFVATYMRLRGNNVIVIAMILITFTIAVSANVKSVLVAFNAGGDLFNTVIGVLLGVGAPLLCLAAGEGFVHIAKAKIEAEGLADENYRRDCEIWDREILKAYHQQNKAQEKAAAKSTKPARENPPSPEIHETPGENASSPVRRVKIHEIARLVHENGDSNMNTSEMMAKYGISLGSTSKVRATLKAYAANGNGRNEPEVVS